MDVAGLGRYRQCRLRLVRRCDVSGTFAAAGKSNDLVIYFGRKC